MFWESTTLPSSPVIMMTMLIPIRWRFSLNSTTAIHTWAALVRSSLPTWRTPIKRSSTELPSNISFFACSGWSRRIPVLMMTNTAVIILSSLTSSMRPRRVWLARVVRLELCLTRLCLEDSFGLKAMPSASFREFVLSALLFSRSLWSEVISLRFRRHLDSIVLCFLGEVLSFLGVSMAHLFT